MFSIIITVVSTVVAALSLTKSGVNGYSMPITDEQRLIRFLTSNYSRLGKPGFNSPHALIVSVRFFPVKLHNLMEKDEALQTTVRIQLNWKDPALIYDPLAFGNQSSVILPGGSIWVPDLQISNSLSDLYGLLRDPRFDFKVYSDGTVWWHPTGNIATRCEVMLAFFPFDYQRCPIMLESVIYTHNQLNLTLRYDKASWSRSMYAESGHWDLVAIKARSRLKYVTNSTAFTSVEFWLFLGRKSGYYKLNIIFPCGMLSALQMLTFFLPLESSERVPEATTILLSVIVFQSMIIQDLPRSSDALPLLCVYIDLLTGISVISVGEAVLIAYLVSRKHHRRFCPPWAMPLLRCLYRLRPREAYIEVMTGGKHGIGNRKSVVSTAAGYHGQGGNGYSGCRSHQCDDRLSDDCQYWGHHQPRRQCQCCRDDRRSNSLTNADFSALDPNFIDNVSYSLGAAVIVNELKHRDSSRSRRDYQLNFQNNGTNSNTSTQQRRRFTTHNVETGSFLKPPTAAVANRSNGGLPGDDRHFVIANSRALMEDMFDAVSTNIDDTISQDMAGSESHRNNEQRAPGGGSRVPSMRHQASRNSSRRSLRPVLLAPLARLEYNSDESASDCELEIFVNNGASPNKISISSPPPDEQQQTSFNGSNRCSPIPPATGAPTKANDRRGTNKVTDHECAARQSAKSGQHLKPLPYPPHRPSNTDCSYPDDNQGSTSPFSSFKLKQRQRGANRVGANRRHNRSFGGKTMPAPLLLVDWVFLAKVVDYIAFVGCVLAVVGVPVILFGIVPPDSPDYDLDH